MSSAAPFPRKSHRVEQNQMSFANALGWASDPRNWDGVPVMEAPVARVEENDFLVNRYGKDVREAKGEVSLQFARRVLGSDVTEGGEIVVALVDQGDDPRKDDVYQASLEVVEDPYPEEMEDSFKHPILLREIPDGMGYGSVYDFTVNYTGSDYIVFEDDGAEALDGLGSSFDLEDMR
ncbi:MAG: hypothetical protein ABEJ64_03250 [Candidatus Nanohaloarchaea archaeon]